MSSARFQMNFSNKQLSFDTEPKSGVSNRPLPASARRSGALNAPMNDRVYKARPGCSACGKKVA